ncbi:hypothetical protein BJX66DRAFT_296608 [Aspergillus keveii]|uniref:Uncharacterized protein n=1 Tax=Aspergillus keveii TaxID=714993 RepID=A0ABR4GFM0_9EURO
MSSPKRKALCLAGHGTLSILSIVVNREARHGPPRVACVNSGLALHKEGIYLDIDLDRQGERSMMSRVKRNRISMDSRL